MPSCWQRRTLTPKGKIPCHYFYSQHKYPWHKTPHFRFPAALLSCFACKGKLKKILKLIFFQDINRVKKIQNEMLSAPSVDQKSKQVINNVHQWSPTFWRLDHTLKNFKNLSNPDQVEALDKFYFLGREFDEGPYRVDPIFQTRLYLLLYRYKGQPGSTFKGLPRHI